MRVVADGESLWLELNKEQIYLNNFRKRQRTQSRQYWTMNGVTIHQQLTLEPGKYPRKHKLSVWLIDLAVIVNLKRENGMHMSTN